jgi:hypothetical protein
MARHTHFPSTIQFPAWTRIDELLPAAWLANQRRYQADGDAFAAKAPPS